MTSNMGVGVIIGCGHLGAHLADRLDSQGYRLRVIDPDPEALDLLPERLRDAGIRGQPLDLAVLERAGIENADFVVATTATDDLNLAVALACRELGGAARVVARVDDPARAASCAALGIAIVCTTDLATPAFLQLIGAITGA